MALALTLSWPSPGEAQTQTQGETLGKIELNLTGTITSSVTVSVEGSVNQNGGATTMVTGTGSQGTVDFGNIRGGVPGTGESFRVNSNEAQGTYLVATIRLRTRFSGSGGSRAVLDIQRAAPCGASSGLPCGGPGSLFFAKMVQRVPNQPAAWPTWDQYPDRNFGSSVFSVPEVTYVPGSGNLDDLMANGESIDHQVAVWIPDEASEGTFSAVVTYTVTRL
jgi:hypothetical protein